MKNEEQNIKFLKLEPNYRLFILNKAIVHLNVEVTLKPQIE